MKTVKHYNLAILELAQAIRIIQDINKHYPAPRIHLNPLHYKMNAMKIQREILEQE